MAVKVEVREATVEDVLYIAKRLRAQDISEIKAATLQDPVDALLMTYNKSPMRKTGSIDGEPVALFGVVKQSIIYGGLGNPWLVGTPQLEDHAIAFLRRCKGHVAEMLRVAPVLENYVDTRNLRAMLWLDWLGFELDPPQPYGVLQRPFHKFHMRSF